MAEFTEINVGGRVEVAGNIAPNTPSPGALCLGGYAGIPAKNGSLFVNGVGLFGSPINYPIPGVPEATLMVGPTVEVTCMLPPPPSIFKVSNKGTFDIRKFNPLDVMIGDPGVGVVGVAVNSHLINVLNVTVCNYVSPQTNIVGNITHMGLEQMLGSKTLVGSEFIAALKAQFGKEARSGAKMTTGTSKFACGVVINGYCQVNGGLGFKGLLSGPVARIPRIVGRCTGNKGFDIPHPTQEKKRVRHICVEGPESAIYIRGKLDGTNIIELPEYWTGLVDYDTITVTLTPSGKPDLSLHVKEVTEEKIIISSDNLKEVKCFYQVWVDRLGPELIVEYEGESPADYPGDQSGHSIAGYNYDVRGEEL